MQVQMGCRFIAQASELEDRFLNGSLLVAECDEHFSLSSHIASIECFLKHALPQAAVTCIELLFVIDVLEVLRVSSQNIRSGGCHVDVVRPGALRALQSGAMEMPWIKRLRITTMKMIPWEFCASWADACGSRPG